MNIPEVFIVTITYSEFQGYSLSDYLQRVYPKYDWIHISGVDAENGWVVTLKLKTANKEIKELEFNDVFIN